MNNSSDLPYGRDGYRPGAFGMSLALFIKLVFVTVDESDTDGNVMHEDIRADFESGPPLRLRRIYFGHSKFIIEEDER
jgi:hypothetical protein